MVSRMGNQAQLPEMLNRFYDLTMTSQSPINWAMPGA
jgi:hypothetical protein